MIRAVIIEDEPLAAANLQQMVQQADSNIITLALLDSVSSAISWLSSNEADLIFLDIHLGDDISFSIFKQVKIQAPVIFTTAYDQYAVRAFRMNSLDYLLKPIQQAELHEALDRFKERRHTTNPDFSILQNIFSQQQYKQRFMVMAGQKIKSIPVSEAAYFLSEGRYVSLVTKDKQKYLIDDTMETLEKHLHPNDFFRINRQMIVAFDAISTMAPFSKSRVQLFLITDPGVDVIVSIDRSGDFKKWLNR